MLVRTFLLPLPGVSKMLKIKLRENAPSHRVKNYYGKKVWTVNAKHVEWIPCEHVNMPGHIVQLKIQMSSSLGKKSIASSDMS